MRPATPGGFHATGGVDGVAPQVVAELVAADDPGHHWAGVDADARLERLAAGVGAPGHLHLHGQGQIGDRLGVVGPGLGQPAGGHVGIADGLDLLQPMAPGQLVEGREQLVQDLHHLLGAALLATPGEVDQVGEQHRDLGEAVGDHVLVLLEPSGDRGGQHIQ
jgi:hypothetical protein